MNRSKLNLNTIVFSLGLAAGMMLPASASAQGVFGDMLDNYYAEKEVQGGQGGGVLLRGATREDPDFSGILTNADFGEPEAPLGSGIAILIGAGLGYVALKKKEDEQ